jgi:hypothetical protein
MLTTLYPAARARMRLLLAATDDRGEETTYELRRLNPGDRADPLWRLSKAHEDTTYHLAEQPDGQGGRRLRCNCPAGAQGRRCKHARMIEALRRQLAGPGG